MKRKFLTILTFMMIFVFATAFIACTDYTKPETPEEEKPETVSYSQVVKNGTFYDVTSSDKDDVFNSATSWTVTAAGLAVPTNGKNSADGVFAAALDLTGAKIGSVINEYKIISSETADASGNYADLETPIVFANPGVDSETPLTDKRDENGKVITGEGAEKVTQDNNAFLLASTNTSASIYLKSASVTLEKNSVYKFQFSVASLVEKETSGAFVFIRGDMEKEFLAINTHGAWETKTFYIETNKAKDMTVTVELWLGYGPKKSTSSTYASDGNDKYATRGFALFDNVIATKLVDEVSDEEKEATFLSEYAGYDKDASLHENFLAFSADKDAYSAYYLLDADFANRTHLTSSSYFGDSSTYRKYFYEFRDYSSANTSSTYWTKTSDFTADSNYYGIVNPAILYNGDKLNYSNMSGKFMSSGDWNAKVLNGNRAFNELKEQYVLMIYNNTLGASGFKSADSVVIESNKYYKLSVWAYVWTTTYSGTDSYNGLDSILPAYKSTSNAVSKPTEPTDPTGDKSTYSAMQKDVYNVYSDYVAENTTSVLAGDVKYFSTLSTDEKNKITGFSTSSFLTAFKEVFNPDSNHTYYEEMIDKTKGWLVTLGVATEKAKVSTTTAESFLYSYLYFNYTGNTEVVGTVEYPQAKLEELNFMQNEWLTKAYLQERNANIATKDTMVAAVDKYNTQKTEYDKNIVEYNKAEGAYVDECNAWLAANENKPHATFRITGAGDDINKVSTAVNEWEELTLYVRGNQLSSRTVSINLLYGENAGENNKMIGGVFFDNIEIAEVRENATAADNWNTLSEISDVSEVTFGGLTSEKTAEEVAGILLDEDKKLWIAEKIENTAKEDNDKIALSVEEDTALQSLKIGNVTYNSYKLVYKHNEATASALVYHNDLDKLIKIKPNKYYRIAFQVKTKDLAGTKGLSISLLKKQDGDFSDFDTSVTGYTSEDDWTEVVYYVRGDRSEVYYLTVEFGMGSGTRFDTSSYVKGETWIASFNCLEITSEEYTAAKTGDKIIKELSLSSTSYDIDGGIVKNASYSTVDYTKADPDDFGEDGIKEGSIVPVTNWTEGTVYTNVFETPKAKLEGTKIKWEAVEGFVKADTPINSNAYEIWVKYKDNNKDKTIILDTVGNVTEYELTNIADFDNWMACSFAVKAVNNQAVSPLSSYVQFEGRGEKNVKPSTQNDAVAMTVKAGAKKVTDDFDGSEYKSTYDSIYTIQANYDAAVAVVSDSTSLSANKYYKVSVWVKTEPDVYAGVTLSGTDGSVDAVLSKDGALGYSKIDTEGRWKEFNIYLKTGNFSVSPKINLCLGNPLADVHKMNDSDSKKYYNVEDLSMGSVYFDAVRVSEIKKDEYELAENTYAEAADKTKVLLPADYKLLYKNSETYVYNVQYTLDSFDTWTEKTSDADKYGYEPNNYSHANGDSVTSSEATYTNMTYGIYDANSTSEDMKKALTYLYSNGSDNMVMNDYFSFAAEYTDENWSEYLKDFFKLGREGKPGGNNVLVMSNKLAAGTAQTYNLGSNYKVSIASKGYYKLTFTANTLVAKPVYNIVKEIPQADKDSWSTAKSKYYVKTASSYALASSAAFEDGTDYYTVEYKMEDAYAQMRFDTGDSSVDPIKMYISSYNQDDAYFGSKDAKTYTFYVYNPSSSSKTASWNFRLGNGPMKKVDGTTESADFVVGLFAVDLVSMEEIKEDEYKAGIAANYDEDGDVVDEKGTVLKYSYPVDKDTSGDKEPEKEVPTEPEKDDFWTKLVNDQYFWLYISSFVLGIVIVVVVIVVLVRNFKKRHPKKVVGENIVKTEKDIQVVEPESQEKEEALEADEYVDEIKPVVQQRVLPKKNKKKKKK